MNLSTAIPNQEYYIDEVQFCDPCPPEPGVDCMGCGIVSLLDKGVIPGEKLIVKRKTKNLIWFVIDGGGEYMIRTEKAYLITLKQ